MSCKEVVVYVEKSKKKKLVAKIAIRVLSR